MRSQPESDLGHRHEIWIHQVDRPALVLGSTQRILPPADQSRDEPLVDPIGRVEVLRRRSGGGLVYVEPDSDIWIDAIVPPGSDLHRDDVGQAFEWIGLAWLQTLAEVIQPVEASDQSAFDPLSGTRGSLPIDQRLQMGPVSPSPAPSRRPFFCFAEVGRGEVMVDDRKVVGISQRRTRHWTRLQTLFLPEWRPAVVNEVVQRIIGPTTPPDRRFGAGPYDANAVAAGLPSSAGLREGVDVVASFLAHLPTVA